jgi:alkylated DNA repair dioxygenase AlkB
MGIERRRHCWKKWIWVQIIVWFRIIVVVLSLSSKTTTESLTVGLQRCYTPKSILEDVGRHINPKIDPSGLVSSLILVRLSKQLVGLDNLDDSTWTDDTFCGNLSNVVRSFSNARWEASPRSIEAAIEGTKSASVLSRLVPDMPKDFWIPIREKWNQSAASLARELQPQQLSGLRWSFDCFGLTSEDWVLPPQVQESYDKLQLPFRIHPSLLREVHGLSVPRLAKQARFKVEHIRTKSNTLVQERRQTAWEGDSHVAPFEYSGKSMKRENWSPLVKQVRDRLHSLTGDYFDCCLLNLYPDGGSGMRYHADPDQGDLWDYETCVVSVGATRRFAFRDVLSNKVSTVSSPHVFVLMSGDVTEMFGDCQQRFQHTVKTADNKKEKVARASLVFKKSLGK